MNLPLPEARDGRQYAVALAKALRVVAGFDSAFVVVALGLDPAKGDPATSRPTATTRPRATNS